MSPGEGTELLLREPRARARARRAVQASLLAFCLIAEALVAGIGTAYEEAWILLVGVGVLGIVLAVFDDLRWRIREVPPHRSTRRLLVITPESASFRDAPRPLALHLDGQPVVLGAAPRLEVTRAGGHYDVNLVLDREIIVLDSKGGHEAAIARAGELATALDLTPPLADQTVGAPAVSERNEAYVILIMLSTLTSSFGVVYWFAHGDLSDHVALPLALTAVLLGSLFTLGRRLCLRRLQVEAAKHARFSRHLSTEGVVRPQGASRYRDKGIVFALSGLVVLALVAAQQLGAQDLPKPTSNCFQSRGAHICRSDENGDGIPEAIGLTCDYDWSLSAIDAKSGKILLSRQSWGNEGASFCELPLITVSSNDSEDRIEVAVWRPRFNTSEPAWKATFKGKLLERLRSDDCALFHILEPGSHDVWKALSLATGDVCASIAELVSPASLDAIRLAQEKRARGPEPGLQISNGVTYSLEKAGTGASTLLLSAWRGETLLWSTTLPARPLDELPLAVAGSMVVVGGSDLRTGKYLRILGVDAATGEIRYVRRHPRDPKARVDLAAAGAMVFVEAGRLAGVEAASGQIAWITKE